MIEFLILFHRISAVVAIVITARCNILVYSLYIPSLWNARLLKLEKCGHNLRDS